MPDPSWPPVPPGHVWWERVPLTRGQVIRRVALAVLLALPVGGCMVLAAVAPPCAFDPPPGDVQDLVIANDTSTDAVVAECDDDRCAHRGDSVRIEAQTSGRLQIEACNGGELGVSRRDGETPYGCVTEPIENRDYQLPTVLVSSLHRC